MLIPPPFPTEERREAGTFSEGRARVATDKQQRKERGALVGLQHEYTLISLNTVVPLGVQTEQVEEKNMRHAQ